MRLLVVGATGRVGSRVLARALEDGHDVTALARDPAALTAEHPRVRVAAGDVLDRASLERALAGCEAVISCLGTRDRRQRTLRADGTRNLVDAMRATRVRRLILFSAFGVGDSRALLRRTTFMFGRVILPLFLRAQFEDMDAMERIARASGLDWVAVRPSALTEKAATGAVRVAEDGARKAGESIAMADVAAFMVGCLTSDVHLGTAPVIYSANLIR